MFAKSIAVVVLVVCLAGPIVSSPTKAMDLGESHYEICRWFSIFAKNNRGPKLWKPQLESVCSLQKDEKFVKKCKKTAAKYLEDLAKKPEMEFCQEHNIVDVDSTDRPGQMEGEPDYSVCKYLVGYANSAGAPSSWSIVFQNACLMIDPLYGYGYCEKTVAKYMRDFQEQPDHFCSELKLVDI